MQEAHFREVSTEKSLRDFFQIIFRHRRKVAGCFLTVVALSVLSALFSPAIYQSDARLLLRLGRESVTLDPTVSTGQVISISQSRESEINSELEILKSHELTAKVVDAVGPESLVGAASMGQASPGDRQEAKDAAIREIEEALDIEALKDSNIINISFQAQSPELAQKVVTKLIELYREQHIAAHRTTGSYEFFVQQTQELQSSLGHTEEKLRDLKNSTDIGALDEQRKILLSRIGRLQQDIEQTNADLRASRAKARSMKGMLRGLPETLVTQETSGLPNTAADGMRQKLYELQLKAQDIESKYNENSEPVRNIRQQVAEMEALLAREDPRRTQVTKGLNGAHEQVKRDLLTEEASVSSLSARANSLREALADAKKDLKTLNETEVQMAQLERQLGTEKVNYGKYSENLEQARISEQLENQKISNIGVVQSATYDNRPVRPRRMLDLALGLFLGILSSLGLAFVSEFLDHSLKKPQDIQEKLRLPMLVAIPDFGANRPLPVLTGGREPRPALPAATPDAPGKVRAGDLVPTNINVYSQTLWDHLAVSTNGTFRRPSILAVTSCHSGEGASSVAASLATTLRRESGGRVLLVDAGAIRRSGKNGRFILPVNTVDADGKLTPVDQSGYEWATTADLPALLKRDDSFVVLDTPALLEAASAVRLCSLADGVILVVESEKTRWEVAEEAKERLQRANANVLGVVLNRRRFHIPEWLYQKL